MSNSRQDLLNIIGEFLFQYTDKGSGVITLEALISKIVEEEGGGDLKQFLSVVLSGDDKGIKLLDGQMSIGEPGNGNELVIGEGDSYPIGDNNSVAFHCDTANTTGLTITNAIEVTTELGSDEGSTAALFNGNTTGKYLLVGSDHPFGGVKAKIDTMATVEPANIIGQYLRDNLPSWISTPYMVTDANNINAIGSQKGWNIATCDSCSEQWRFGFDPIDLPTTWNKSIITINGIEYNRYWARFLITSDITGDPILEQLKLHTNRYEVNSDGTTEYFGRSRYSRVLQSGIKSLTVNAAGSAQNENVNYTADIIATRTSNEFRNGFEDDALITQTIPVGLDTSIPLLLKISYYPISAVTGDVEFEADVVKVSDGFTYDGSATSTTYSAIDTITSPAALERKTTTVKVLVNELTDNDGIVIRLRRDATAGNADDTLASNIVLTHFELVGYFWKP